MRRAALLVAVALAGCASDEPKPRTTTATGGSSGDVAALVDAVVRYHPDPWHAVPETVFRAAADELGTRYDGLGPDEKLVELMRLVALLGERDGHSGIFPLDAHERELSLYPVRLYDFPEGLVVVGAVDRPELVGARVEEVAGVPVDELRELVAPLVPRDNEQSLAARLPQFMVTAEVLHGLGLTESAGPVTLTLAGGETVEMAPVPAFEYAAAFPDLFHPMVPTGLPERPEPPYLARRLEDRWLTTLEDGRVVYAAYNVTLGDTSDFAAELRRLARRPDVERVVLDLRHNPGGNNTTYGPLLEELVTLGDPVVLTSRTTFSAAANLLAELEGRAEPVLVGEPTGGSPNLYGDPVSVDLLEAGLTAQVAGVYWELVPAGDPRLAFEPDVPVDLTAADFLAGRDPVLTAALRRAPR